MMQKRIGLALAAIIPLAGCAAPPLSYPYQTAPYQTVPYQTAGLRGPPVYPICRQGDYACAMQQMDYQAWLELVKGQDGGRD